MASVTSLDKDLRRLRLDKYTPAAAAEARHWIEGVLAEPLARGDLLEALRDGVTLCRLVNLALPPPGVRFKQSSMPFVQMENISQFLAACQQPPLNLHQHDMFLTVDLYEQKDPAQVLQCLGAFSRAAHQTNPARFPAPIGPARPRSGVLSPHSTGPPPQSPLSPSSLSTRNRGISSASSGSNPALLASYRTSTPIAPAGTGDSAAGRWSPIRSPTKSPAPATPSSPGAAVPVSSWSRKEHETSTTPAWNIAQYGYMGGASQGSLGISFGGRRQITSAGPHVPPSLAEKQRRRREKEAEEERQRLLAEEEQRRRLEEQEERARLEEERRWEAETTRQREDERRQAEEERRRWEEEERMWKITEEKRRREEEAAEARLAEERRRARAGAGGAGDGPEGDYAARVRELERELERARQREAEYERERAARPPGDWDQDIDHPDGEYKDKDSERDRDRERDRERDRDRDREREREKDRDKARARSRSRHRPPSRQDSWSRDQREVLHTPRGSPNLSKSPRPLPDPAQAWQPQVRTHHTGVGSSRPLPDPDAYAAASAASSSNPRISASANIATPPPILPPRGTSESPAAVRSPLSKQEQFRQSELFLSSSSPSLPSSSSLSSSSSRPAPPPARPRPQPRYEEEPQDQDTPEPLDRPVPPQKPPLPPAEARPLPSYPREVDAGAAERGEGGGEDRRRRAKSQSQAQAGPPAGLVSQSLLEREMEMERQRQREWEEAQRETAQRASAGPVDGVGGRWDVSQWSGFTGGDGQNRGGQGIGASRRQIVGPRPLPGGGR